MAFFSSGSDKEKLMILYSLKKAGIPLSREQIVGIMSENGLENYIDIAQHIMELEGNACLATVPTYRRQTIVLTTRGEEVVSLFAKTLPRSLRDGIDAYVERKLDDFRRENTSQAETRRISDTDYTTSLALVENGDAFFEIRIKLPSAKYTRIAERQWDRINQKLYLQTLLALTQEESAESLSDSAAEPEKPENDQ